MGISKQVDPMRVPTPCEHNQFVNFVQCWTNVEDVGPTLYKCYTNVLCLLGRRTFSQTLYICAMLVQCWASVADVGLTLKQRWVSVRWSSIQSYNQVTSSTTLYCILKAYTHASLEPDSIFNISERSALCIWVGCNESCLTHMVLCIPPVTR